MAKLMPTIDEIKEELRIDFAADDDLITRYIESSAERILAQMKWAQADTVDFRLWSHSYIGSNAIRIPIRGVVVEQIQYTDTDGDAQEVAAADDTYHTDETSDSHRKVRYLVPATTWRDALPDMDASAPTKVVGTADDAPPVILQAIAKVAVDYYRNNGLGSEPVRSAVDRSLQPFMVYQ